MAFNQAPNQWLANISEDGTDLTIRIADVDELTAAECDAATGDMRAVMYRLMDDFYSYINGLPTEDQPGQLSITRTRFEDGNSKIRSSFILEIVTDSAGTTVTAE